MKKQVEQRLEALKDEYETGQKMLADLEAKQVNLRETLLRISGAIQVLEEVLNDAPVENGNGSHPIEVVAETQEMNLPANVE